jgi:hypothetical protein
MRSEPMDVLRAASSSPNVRQIMNTQNYVDEFNQAQRFSVASQMKPTELNLQPSAFLQQLGEAELVALVDQAYLQPKFGEGFKKVLLEHNQFRRPEDRENQCVPVHAMAWAGLSAQNQKRCVLTLGFVIVDGRTFYAVSTDDLLARAESVGGPSVQLHAWLTFDSGEVLDYTLAPSLSPENCPSLPRCDELIFGYPWESHGIEYHPVATGAYWGIALKIMCIE